MTLLTEEINQTIEWLESIESSIEDDIPPAMNLGESRGGYYSTLRLIFCYVDTFGAHYKGDKPTSANAVDFIKEYFGRVNTRYKEIAGILYTLLRHGTIHTFQPKSFTVNNKRFGYVIGKDIDVIPNSNDSDFKWKTEDGGDDQIYSHLIPKLPDPSTKIAIDNPGIKMFPLSLSQLYKDFKQAVSLYIQDCKSDDTLKENAFKVMKNIKKPAEFIIENGVVKEKHPYVKNQKDNRKYIDVSELSNL